MLDRLRLHELERLRVADVPLLEAWAFVVTHPDLGTRDLRGCESVTHTRAVRTLASILDRSDPDGVETARALGLLHVCDVARDATDALGRILRGEFRSASGARVQLGAVRATLEALGLL